MSASVGASDLNAARPDAGEPATEVPLTLAQRTYLERQLRPGQVIRTALGEAALLPFALVATVAVITRVLARVPVIGWVLAIYGMVAMVAAVMIGVLLIPFAIVVIIPVTFLRRRPVIRDALARGVAIRRSGRFPVELRKHGNAKLSCGEAKLSLSKAQVEQLGTALAPSDGREAALAGSVTHLAHYGRPLLICDESGTKLVELA